MTEKAGQSPSWRAFVTLLSAFLVLTALVLPGMTTAAGRAQPVEIVFTGKGGGRYLDHTRWLREDTRLCYARRLADETLSVQWRIAWSASLVRTADGYALTGLRPTESTIQGSVEGTSVRDSCDSADEEPGWSGTTPCVGQLPVRSAGGISARSTPRGLSLRLRGPIYASPGSPCELDIRNDQLVSAAVLKSGALARLGAGRSLSIPVGTRHPALGIAYQATRSCSLFPHIYDGVVYLYECDDTLIWSGGLTIDAA